MILVLMIARRGAYIFRDTYDRDLADYKSLIMSWPDISVISL